MPEAHLKELFDLLRRSGATSQRVKACFKGRLSLAFCEAYRCGARDESVLSLCEWMACTARGSVLAAEASLRKLRSCRKRFICPITRSRGSPSRHFEASDW